MAPAGSTAIALEPLTVGHAEVMFRLLSDPALYTYLDHGPPPDLAHLQGVYRRLEARRSPDGTQRWLNWIVTTPHDGAVGYVQATVLPSGTAWVAYVLGRPFQGRGYARAAVAHMLGMLRQEHACSRFLACAERANAPSLRLLAALGFREATAEELAGHDLSPTEVLHVGS